MTHELLYSLGALAALLFSALFSGIETGVYCVNRLKLRLAAERRERGSRRLSWLVERSDELVITTLLGTNVSDYVLTACLTALLLSAALSAGAAELYTTAIATPLVLVFGGIVPKDWFRRDADRLMLRLAGPLVIAHRLARWSGALWLLRAWTRWLIGRIDPQRATSPAQALPRARAMRLLREGAASGGLSQMQREMIERVMSISKVPLMKIMIPRQRAAMVPENISREDLLRAARMAHFSRLPVYRGDPRRVIGIINVYDILTDEQKRPVPEYVQPAVQLRAEETVPAALLKLQRAHQAMAIVTDPAGHCLGLFTIKDLVEEIIGELEAW